MKKGICVLLALLLAVLPALTAIDFYIFPSTLADFFPDQYAEAKEKLRLAN